MIQPKNRNSTLQSKKGIGNISSDFDLSRPEIKIKPDFNKAAKLGVTAKILVKSFALQLLGLQ